MPEDAVHVDELAGMRPLDASGRIWVPRGNSVDRLAEARERQRRAAALRDRPDSGRGLLEPARDVVPEYSIAVYSPRKGGGGS